MNVLITGTSRGIGLEFVRQYLAKGDTVFAAARNPEDSELSGLKSQYPERLFLVTMDVSDENSISLAAEQVKQQTPSLDIVINNAGISPRMPAFGNFRAEELLNILNVNAVAPIMVAQAFWDLLLNADKPRLINITSQLGSFDYNQGGSVYGASKSALNMLTRTISKVNPKVITVLIHPGWVQTDMGGSSASLTTNEAVSEMVALFDRLTPEHNRQFLKWNGQPHAW